MPQARAATSTSGGRYFLILLGLSIALIGGLFVFLMGRSFLRAREMHTWPQVQCVILTSEIAERRHDPTSPLEYRHEVSYGYDWKGTPYTGELFSLRGSPWSSKQKLAEERRSAYPLGSVATCSIDPKNPSRAVLKVDSLAPGYSIWFPSLFVIGGLGISFRAAKTGNKQ